MRAVEDAATTFGEELDGAVRARAKSGNSARSQGTIEVHAGRKRLGILSWDALRARNAEAIVSMFRTTRVVWVDVIKPSDPKVSWPEFSAPLFALQWALPQLMNAAIDECRLAERATAGNEKALKAPDTLAYQVITSDEQQERLRAQARKIAERTHSQHRKSTERAGSAWDERARFTVSGAVASCASRMVATLYKRWRKSQEGRDASGKFGYPDFGGRRLVLPLRNDSWKLTQDVDRIVLHFTICANTTADGASRSKSERWQSCFVAPKGGSAWAQVRKLLTGEFEPTEAKLRWNDRKRRWQVGLTYRAPRVPVRQASKYLLVRRSAHHLLFCITNDGKICQTQGLVEILKRRKQELLARKSRVKAGLNFQGRGARGHGKKRFYRGYSALQDKEAEITKTTIKQLCSHLGRFCLEHGVGTILIEDFQAMKQWLVEHEDAFAVRMLSRMPWSAAGTALESKAQELGIKTRKVADTHNIGVCPVCKETKSLEFQPKHKRWKCTSCGLDTNAHMIAACNGFLAAGVDTSDLKDLIRRSAAITAELSRQRVPENSGNADAERD